MVGVGGSSPLERTNFSSPLSYTRKTTTKFLTSDRLRNEIDAYHPVSGFNAF